MSQNHKLISQNHKLMSQNHKLISQNHKLMTYEPKRTLIFGIQVVLSMCIGKEVGYMTIKDTCITVTLLQRILIISF